MTESTDNTPVTFDMLQDALEGAGAAFGLALRTALTEIGATPKQHGRVLTALSALDEAGWRGPDAITFGGIVAGYLKP